MATAVDTYCYLGNTKFIINQKLEDPYFRLFNYLNNIISNLCSVFENNPHSPDTLIVEIILQVFYSILHYNNVQLNNIQYKEINSSALINEYVEVQVQTDSNPLILINVSRIKHTLKSDTMSQPWSLLFNPELTYYMKLRNMERLCKSEAQTTSLDSIGIFNCPSHQRSTMFLIAIADRAAQLYLNILQEKLQIPSTTISLFSLLSVNAKRIKAAQVHSNNQLPIIDEVID